MKSSEVQVNEVYTCTSLLLTHPFQGKVVNLLDNSCIVEIVGVDDADKATARELQNRTVVSYKDMN